MFWNKYPYTNFHELNLDWILQKIKEMDKSLSEFEALNKITFDGEWDITKQYPAWCIVNTNGGTEGYISIQPVPAGVTIDNTDYWSSVVNYTATIADLQNKVSDILNTYLPEKEDKTRRAIVLTDSYGNYTNADSKTFGAIASDITGIPVDFLHRGGCGFVGDGTNTFLALLQTYSGDASDVTDIIVVGGANDYAYTGTYDDLVAAIETFYAYAKTTFTSLKRVAVMATTIVFGTFTGYKGARSRVWTADAYSKGCANCGAIYVTNSQYIMHDTRLTLSDFCHPNPDGVDEIGGYLAQVINGADCVNVSRELIMDQTGFTLDPTFVSTYGASLITGTYSFRQYMQNGFGRFGCNGGFLAPFGFYLTSALPAGTYTMGTISDSLFSTYEDDSAGFLSIPGFIYTEATHSNANRVIGSLIFYIEDNKIKIYVITPTLGTQVYGFYPLCDNLIMSTD